MKSSKNPTAIPALVKPDSELGWVYACSNCRLVNYGGPVSKCGNCGEVVDHNLPAILQFRIMGKCIG